MEIHSVFSSRLRISTSGSRENQRQKKLSDRIAAVKTSLVMNFCLVYHNPTDLSSAIAAEPENSRKISLKVFTFPAVLCMIGANRVGTSREVLSEWGVV